MKESKNHWDLTLDIIHNSCDVLSSISVQCWISCMRQDWGHFLIVSPPTSFSSQATPFLWNSSWPGAQALSWGMKTLHGNSFPGDSKPPAQGLAPPFQPYHNTPHRALPVENITHPTRWFSTLYRQGGRAMDYPSWRPPINLPPWHEGASPHTH